MKTVPPFLKKPGLTEDGIRFITKAFHPPGPFPPAQMPDHTTVPTTFPEYREVTVIDAPLDDSWDCMIVKTPGNVVGAFICAGPAGTDFAKMVGDTRPANVRLTQVLLQPTVVTPPVSHSTYKNFDWPNATPPFPDETKVIIAGPSVFVQTRWPEGAPALWRKTASSLTAHLTASTLTNQGTVYATQVGREYQRGSLNLSFDTAPTYRDLYRERNVTLPLDEEQMAAMDPKFYTTEARKGVYMPLKHIGVMEWVQPDRRGDEIFGSFNTGTAVGGVGTLLAHGPELGGLGYAPLACTPNVVYNDDTTGNWTRCWAFPYPDFDNDYYAVDSGYDAWTTGVVIFRGLHPDATISLRLHDVIEQCPLASSAYRPFISPPRLLSNKALELYWLIAQRSPNAYPADFNSWGKVWDVIKDVVHEVWPVAKTVAEAVIPVASRGKVSPAMVRGFADDAAAAVNSVARVVDRASTAKKPAPKSSTKKKK